MRHQIANSVAIAISRAVLIILGGVTLCATLVAAVGFALIALYSTLTPTLGTAGAAFATSGAALAIPAVMMIISLIVTRRWILAELPVGQDASVVESISMKSLSSKEQIEVLSLEHTLGWISQHPRSATLGALSFGIALGAYPDIRRTVLNGVDTALDQQRAALR